MHTDLTAHLNDVSNIADISVYIISVGLGRNYLVATDLSDPSTNLPSVLVS